MYIKVVGKSDLIVNCPFFYFLFLIQAWVKCSYSPTENWWKQIQHDLLGKKSFHMKHDKFWIKNHSLC